MRAASLGTGGRADAGPANWIRPSWMRTAPSGTGARPVPSMSAPFWISVAPWPFFIANILRRCTVYSVQFLGFRHAPDQGPAVEDVPRRLGLPVPPREYPLRGA